MINNISLHQFNKIKQQTKVSFGTIEKEFREGNRLKYRNDTYFFRDDINWSLLADKITEGKHPKRIYCYACSDGSEPYSIAISLIAKLGYEKAQKYFPIIARDIDDYILERAQSGYIELDSTDIIRMNENVGNKPYSFFKKEKPSQIFDDCFIYKVDDRLKRCVCFAKGNLADEAVSLDLSNTAIFFRNVWPYLTIGQQQHIMKTLSQKMGSSTLLVTGSYDHRKAGNKLSQRLGNLGLFHVYPFIYKKCSISNPAIRGKVFLAGIKMRFKMSEEILARFFNYYI